MSTSTEVQPLIGKSVDALDTPAMVVDIELLEANLKLMADYFNNRSCQIRPHFKSHKCVELARRQLAAGSACGITCAKLSEAEQLAVGGIDDILIANQVVGPRKAARLAELNESATVRCAVDSIDSVKQLNEQANSRGVTIPVLVEVDIGMKRCGIPPGEPTLRLTQNILDCDYLRFDGLQGYEGHLVTIVNPSERRQKTIAAIDSLIATRRLIEESGIQVPIVSGGSSSTFDVTGNIDGIDEVQCGSYALMDWSYQRLRPEFCVARWILSTVISANSNGVVTDVGLKGIACDFGPPKVEEHPEATVRYTAEEHIPLDGVTASIGDHFRLIPSHGCTTNSLHRRMWITRDEQIIDVWEIEGAGCLE